MMGLRRYRRHGTAGNKQLYMSDDTQHNLVMDYPPVQTAIVDVIVCACVCLCAIGTNNGRRRHHSLLMAHAEKTLRLDVIHE